MDSQPAGTLSNDARRVADWLRLLIVPGQVFEIRALRCSTKNYRNFHNRGGWFDYDHLSEAANAALWLTHPKGGNAGSVYFTLNPVLPDLIARRANRVDVMDREFRSTEDSDITHRQLLFVDCDPVRPSGVSSTDSESQSSRLIARQIHEQLSNDGWPAPIVANSGNGWHLVYRIDLPAEDGDVVKSCLRALSHRFSTDKVSVDTKVFNPSRICKLYGTFSRKGDHTEARPHRRSYIASAPSPEEFHGNPVSRELLLSLAAKAPAELRSESHSRREPPANSIIARARRYLLTMPESISGQSGHDKAYRAACELIRGFSLPQSDAFELLQEFNERCQPPWTENELWHKIEQAEKHAEGQPGYLLLRNADRYEATQNGNHRPTNGDQAYEAVEFAPFAVDATAFPATASRLAGSNPLDGFDLIFEQPAGERPIVMAPQVQQIDRPVGGSNGGELEHATSDRSILEDSADPARLARDFLSRRYTRRPGRELTLRYWQQSFYAWRQHCWARVDDHEMKAELTLWIDDEFASLNEKLLEKPDPSRPAPAKKMALLGTIENVLNHIQAKSLLPTRVDPQSFISGPLIGSDPLRYVSVRNGMIDLQSIHKTLPACPDATFDPDSFDDDSAGLAPRFDLIDNTPHFFNLASLPVQYDHTATCPKWLEFLDTNLQGNEEEILLLQQWFGYCLTPDTSLQKFLMLEGDGRNGKSVICAALRALLGSDSVSAVSLGMFSDTRSLDRMQGKLANIVSELGEVDKISEEVLKSLVTGEPFSIDRKYKSIIEVAPKARLLFATNNRPRFTDRSSGLWRRLMLLPITYRVSDAEVIPGMDSPNYWQDELAGILNWALAGLLSLRTMGKFVEPEACREAKSDYQYDSNPHREFICENYEYDPDAAWTVPCQRIYEAYKNWCKECGYHPLNERNFGKEVKSTFAKMATGGQVERKYRGLKADREWVYTHVRTLVDYSNEFT